LCTFKLFVAKSGSTVSDVAVIIGDDDGQRGEGAFGQRRTPPFIVESFSPAVAVQSRDSVTWLILMLPLFG
jgi:hypothetical protein